MYGGFDVRGQEENNGSCGMTGGGMVQKTPAVVEIQQVRGTGGMDFHLKTKETGREGYATAFPPCLALFCGYNSASISFTSVGRHFPKNMALQSENPSR
ncbi:MAG: hypothetical protein K2J99_02220 [Lachnospiraceae bacterium]|nr:hypothetical protein [Lachnospiraceae bacterium]